MATQQQVHRQGQLPQPYDFSNFERDSVHLPVRLNIGFALGSVLTLLAIVALVIYYVL